MTVARYSPADRARWTSGFDHDGQRQRMVEGWLLSIALGTIALGLVLTYLAVAAPFDGLEEALETGRIVHLGELQQPQDLLPLLGTFTDPSERSFVAERIWDDLTRIGADPLPNVGALSGLRVTAAELAGRTLPVLDSRIEALRDARPDLEPDELRLRLLSSEQLRDIKPLAVVRRPAAFRNHLLLWTGLVFAAFMAAHLIWRRRRFVGDPMLLPVAALLTGLGLLAMVSIWDPLRDRLYFITFAQGTVLGCLGMAVLAVVDFERPLFRRLTFPALLGAFALSLLLILFGSGPGTSDAKVNLFGFQPVEVVKLLMVFFLAGYFDQRWEMLREIKERRGAFARLERLVHVPKLEYVLVPVTAVALLLIFFFLQKDLGPALVLSLLFVCLYGVARGSPVMAVVGLALIVAGFATGYQLGAPRTVAVRIAMWLSPWENRFAGGDHLAESLWAFATGGLTGTGPGLGQPGHVPAAHTDMVLTVLGEELGFIGLLAIVALFAILLWRGLRIADRAAGTYGYFLALGFSLLLGVELLLIACGVTGLLPLSGVVTPFLSYGRSAMLANFAILGVLLGISGQATENGTVGRRFQRGTTTIGLLLALGLGTLLVRLADVQVLRADQVVARGCLAIQADGYRRFRYNPRLTQLDDLIPRGSILDRHGTPLALSEPSQLSDEDRDALTRLGARPDLAGDGRYYPFGGKTFHLLGDDESRVNWAASNTSFVERDSRVRLQGYDDYAEIRRVRQPNGQESFLVERDYRELIPLLRNRHRPDHPAVRRIVERDRDVRLSIDVRLQLGVADLLARGASAHRGTGAAVVLDAATGDVLASVSVPWPEGRPITAAAGVDRLLDRSRYGVYPPGSTFKIVTAMAALRTNPEVMNQEFECVGLGDGRVGNRVRGWGRPIRDDPTVSTPHGKVNLQKGIRVSCNAYFAQLATSEIGPGPLLDTAAMLGIAVARPNTSEQLADSLPQSAYGQGQVTATPFQMARVAAAVANGGLAPQGRWVLDNSNDRNQPPVRIVSESQAAILAEAMREVVTRGSAARVLGSLDVPIAGKTGTAEVQGAPSHSWFIGFAPADGRERKIAFAVLIEHGGYGGRAAAEVAGGIVRQLEALGEGQ